MHSEGAAMNIFVTGTDTNVGKTTVSAWLCMHSKANYWKPIQTGMEFDGNVVKSLSPSTAIIAEIYKLKAPLSPYDAANLENKILNIESLGECSNTIVEGAGGVLVPVAENFFMVDLIKKCNARALIVVKSQLGMINHTLMTVEAIKVRKIDILGMIINGETENNILSTIEKFSSTKILGVIPRSNNLLETLQETIVPREILETIR
jgi:dethiobiotin synthase